MPEGLPAELKAAIEAFFATKRAREKRMKTLGEKAKLPGVKVRGEML